MTVKDLLEKLKSLPQNLEIRVCGGDDELMDFTLKEDAVSVRYTTACEKKVVYFDNPKLWL